MNSIYLAIKLIPGFAVAITTTNKLSLLNIIANALYYNYKKKNYHRMILGITEFCKIADQYGDVLNLFYFQDILNLYHLELINGINIRNYIRDYDPKLYFPYTDEKIEYIFQYFNKNSQIKIKKHGIEFHDSFFNDLISYITKLRMENITYDDQFINKYLAVHNVITEPSLRNYIALYIKDLMASALQNM
jgi:hypothetical protein